jgi:hypothetical protein
VVQDKVLNPLIPRKYTVLNGNFVFGLWDVFQEHNPDVKQDLPVLSISNNEEQI